MQASLNEWGEYWEEEEKWDIVIYKENIYFVIQMAKTWNFLNVESDNGVFFFFFLTQLYLLQLLMVSLVMLIR